MAIDRSFHPFIAGPNNETILELQTLTNTRILLAPLALNQTGSAPLRNVNEIVITGDKNGVVIAEEKINALHAHFQKVTRTLVLPINKKQHRFIIGPKGSVITEILERTGCYVELPLQSDPSDMVTVRGPENALGVALNMIIEKVKFSYAYFFHYLKVKFHRD